LGIDLEVASEVDVAAVHLYKIGSDSGGQKVLVTAQDGKGDFGDGEL
jgi:hypothetical protein